MPLEQHIVEWSETRPAWQRAVLRRISAANPLSPQEHVALVDAILHAGDVGNADFTIADFPATNASDPPVSLVSIANTEHVNALSSDTPLTFEPSGLTIVYGDNASGKSGYARLLKLVARARHQEEILSDVFVDTALAKPQALITVHVGAEQKVFVWPYANPPELRRMLFYDQACGVAYIAAESEFLYRPAALFIMDGLIDVCVAVRTIIDDRLDANQRSAKRLPQVDDDIRHTPLARFLLGLQGTSSLDTLDQLLAALDSSDDSLSKLESEEARLRSADTTAERQRLIRTASKLDSLRSHIHNLHIALNEDAVTDIQHKSDQLSALQAAADVVAHAFASEPVSGVGTSPWKELWSSAQRFSEAHAYPGESFPVVTGDARCVLCQQNLNDDAQKRMERFKTFVHDDTQMRLVAAQAAWGECEARVRNLRTSPDLVDSSLADLEQGYDRLVIDVREIIAKYESARQVLLNSMSGGRTFAPPAIEPTDLLKRLDMSSADARTAADGLSDAQKIAERLRQVTTQRKELQLARAVAAGREAIVAEIERLRQRDQLEAVKSSAATGPITKKILELSEDNITEVVRDAFTRESERLQLQRVTLTRTRADKGALLHQPKLVGARQNVTLPRVFSEGERTALGLAGFLTEAQLDSSNSALILDDPVTSLDHIRSGAVASRLAALAVSRQVIIFTHDVSFVSYLKREAKGLGVSVAERSVTRARAGERKPGTCTGKHPWKAKDVAERLGELRLGVARIKKESPNWDDRTYENEVASWAGELSETWERIFSQELVGQILAEGGLEVRPSMVKVLAAFSSTDDAEFQASYSRISQWAKRHDKSSMVNYVAPEVATLEQELALVERWFKRVKAYKN